MTLADDKTGVLLMALGGPSCLDEVEPYLAQVRHGRETPRPFIEDIKSRYRQIGGKSPLPEIVHSQALALEKFFTHDAVRSTHNVSRVYIGMRHSSPFIKDAFKRMVEDGVSRIAAICLAPQYSDMSVGAYFKEIEACRRHFKTGIKVAAVNSWATNHFLLKAWAKNIEEAKGLFDAKERKNLQIIFTAHSLPTRIVQEGDPYVSEVMSTAQGVAQLMGLKEWYLAYQSKSQSPNQEEWLGPSVEEVLERLSSAGCRNVLVAPIGFVCDNLEILYDVDIVFKRFAQARGMRLERPASLNTNPLLIQALASLVLPIKSRSGSLKETSVSKP